MKRPGARGAEGGGSVCARSRRACPRRGARARSTSCTCSAKEHCSDRRWPSAAPGLERSPLRLRLRRRRLGPLREPRELLPLVPALPRRRRPRSAAWPRHVHGRQRLSAGLRAAVQRERHRHARPPSTRRSTGPLPPRDPRPRDRLDGQLQQRAVPRGRASRPRASTAPRRRFRMVVVGGGRVPRRRAWRSSTDPGARPPKPPTSPTSTSGSCPSPTREWERGKCGLKALQYMALGIPVVVSPVGVNAEIVGSGREGYLARTEEEWESALERLLRIPPFAAGLGEAGRLTVERSYSAAVGQARAWRPSSGSRRDDGLPRRRRRPHRRRHRQPGHRRPDPAARPRRRGRVPRRGSTPGRSSSGSRWRSS